MATRLWFRESAGQPQGVEHSTSPVSRALARTVLQEAARRRRYWLARAEGPDREAETVALPAWERCRQMHDRLEQNRETPVTRVCPGRQRKES